MKKTTEQWVLMLGLVTVIFVISLIPLHFVWASGGNNNGHANTHTGDSTASAGDSESTSSAAAGDSRSVSTGGDSRVLIVNSPREAGGTVQGGTVDVVTGDTVLQTIHRYDEVAQTVSSLHLGRCSNGGGAGDKRASFNVGGSDFLCDITYTVPLITGKATNLWEQGRYPEAYAELQKIDHLIDMAVDYLNDRSKTASFGAWFRDLWWVLAIALVAL